MLLHGGVAIALTYALSWLVLKGVEEPLRSILVSGRIFSEALLQRVGVLQAVAVVVAQALGVPVRHCVTVDVCEAETEAEELALPAAREAEAQADTL
jgi:hypothetical protein